MERSPILKEMIQKGEIILIGGIHNIANGEITFFLKKYNNTIVSLT